LIGDLAFEGCRKLTYVEILSPSIKLGYNIFKDCTSLECIYIPKGSKNYYSSFFPKKEHVLYEQ
jgi:hypothetical protein